MTSTYLPRPCYPEIAAVLPAHPEALKVKIEGLKEEFLQDTRPPKPQTKKIYIGPGVPPPFSPPSGEGALRGGSCYYRPCMQGAYSV